MSLLVTPLRGGASTTTGRGYRVNRAPCNRAGPGFRLVEGMHPRDQNILRKDIDDILWRLERMRLPLEEVAQLRRKKLSLKERAKRAGCGVREFERREMMRWHILASEKGPDYSRASMADIERIRAELQEVEQLLRVTLAIALRRIDPKKLARSARTTVTTVNRRMLKVRTRLMVYDLID